MNIKNRLIKIEDSLNVNSGFCTCGTPYYVEVITPGKSLANEFCPVCSKRVKPQTFAEYALEADKYEAELLLPKFTPGEKESL